MRHADRQLGQQRAQLRLVGGHLGIGPRQVGELLQEPPPGHQRAGVGLLQGLEDGGTAPARRGEQPLQLACELAHELEPAAALRPAEAVDGLQGPAIALPHGAGAIGCLNPLAAQDALEPVGELRNLEQPGHPKPGEQVGGGPLKQRAAQEGDE